jgi:hypothetical protein
MGKTIENDFADEPLLAQKRLLLRKYVLAGDSPVPTRPGWKPRARRLG